MLYEVKSATLGPPHRKHRPRGPRSSRFLLLHTPSSNIQWNATKGATQKRSRRSSRRAKMLPQLFVQVVPRGFPENVLVDDCRDVAADRRGEDILPSRRRHSDERVDRPISPV